MAHCIDCHLNMLDSSVVSCSRRSITIRGKRYARNSTYFDMNQRCHDCNIVNVKGNVHHAQCDMERCPRCKGQLISCGCLDDPPMKKKCTCKAGLLPCPKHGWFISLRRALPKKK